jgi:hypothetical protein
MTEQRRTLLLGAHVRVRLPEEYENAYENYDGINGAGGQVVHLWEEEIPGGRMVRCVVALETETRYLPADWLVVVRPGP